MRRTRVMTATNSVYIFTEHDDGAFTVSGENVSSLTSKSLGNQEWPIFTPNPWPPKLGQPIFFESLYADEEIGMSLRMPGGGKVTSPVRLIRYEYIRQEIE